MDFQTALVITIISLLLSALFSGTEIAFVTGDRVRAEIDSHRGSLIPRIIKRFYSDADFFISSILVGNNVMLVIYGMGAAIFIDAWLEHYQVFKDSEALSLITQTLISTIVILIVGEFLPKTIFRINPNTSLRIFAFPIFIFYLLFYPISLAASWLSRMLMRLLGMKTESSAIRLLSVGDLNTYLEETIDTLEDKKETVENEVKIFQNALDFSSTHLRDCMTPRNELVAVDIDNTDRETLSKLFTSTGRSKIIVYREDIDNILGYIHVSELFDPSSDWREHIHPVLYAPEPLMANTMMRRLLAEKRSIAVVIDEFGGTAGLVTLEDLVEEIFGDIRDEHDKATPLARLIAPDVYEISGRCEISQLNENYSLDIPEDDDYQTLAGYILHSTGTIPDQGAEVTLGHLKIDVVKKSATRLELLRVTVMPEREED